MIDFASLPWQINVLLMETVVTFLIALVLIARGKAIRRTQALTFSMLAWNAALYALIFTGGAGSWQHWAYVLYVSIDSAALIAKYARGDREIKVNNEHLGVAITFLVILHVVVAWLLIAGC